MNWPKLQASLEMQILVFSVTSWTSRGGDTGSDPHHVIGAEPSKVSPLMGEEPSANSPAVDFWTICQIICWPAETYKTARFTRLRPSPSGWRRHVHKVRWLRHHLLLPCFQTGWWNHEKPVCPRLICQTFVQKESVANRHSCREGDWLQLGISAGAAAASRDDFG